MKPRLNKEDRAELLEFVRTHAAIVKRLRANAPHLLEEERENFRAAYLEMRRLLVLADQSEFAQRVKEAAVLWNQIMPGPYGPADAQSALRSLREKGASA